MMSGAPPPRAIAIASSAASSRRPPSDRRCVMYAPRPRIAPTIAVSSPVVA
jgi:hypothetical protein